MHVVFIDLGVAFARVVWNENDDAGRHARSIQRLLLAEGIELALAPAAMAGLDDRAPVDAPKRIPGILVFHLIC